MNCTANYQAISQPQQIIPKMTEARKKKQESTNGFTLMINHTKQDQLPSPDITEIASVLLITVDLLTC